MRSSHGSSTSLFASAASTTTWRPRPRRAPCSNGTRCSAKRSSPDSSGSLAFCRSFVTTTSGSTGPVTRMAFARSRSRSRCASSRSRTASRLSSRTAPTGRRSPSQKRSGYFRARSRAASWTRRSSPRWRRTCARTEGNSVAEQNIRVVIVDDERLFAELMRVALKAADGIEVQAVVHDLKAAIAALNEYKPDVVIADYHLPDGTGADLARAVRGSLPDTSVLVLTADPSAATLHDVARSGAVGHMTKGRGLNEVVESVRSAASGEILFAPSELQRLLLESAASRKIIEPLTGRELEVLRLLASGTSTTAAAESL